MPCSRASSRYRRTTSRLQRPFSLRLWSFGNPVGGSWTSKPAPLKERKIAPSSCRILMLYDERRRRICISANDKNVSIQTAGITTALSERRTFTDVVSPSICSAITNAPLRLSTVIPERCSVVTLINQLYGEEIVCRRRRQRLIDDSIVTILGAGLSVIEPTKYHAAVVDV